MCVGFGGRTLKLNVNCAPSFSFSLLQKQKGISVMNLIAAVVVTVGLFSAMVVIGSDDNEEESTHFKEFSKK